MLVFVLAACGTSDDGDTAGSGEADGADEAGEMPSELIMGFVPSSESDQIADTVEPLAERLSEELGIPVSGQVMTNYTGLVEAMGNDQVHIGFIPAFGYVLATDRYPQVEVILKSVRNGSGTYRAQYTVLADSDIESIEDLEGKVWVYSDLASTSGYLFPAAQLVTEYDVPADGIDSFFGNQIQAGSHDNALITVLEGGADVATTFEDAREIIEGDYPEAMEDLRVIGYTEEIPNDTISVLNTLPQELIDQIRDVFLSFNEDEDMIKILNDVYRWDAIEEASDDEYDIVRETYELFSDQVSLD